MGRTSSDFSTGIAFDKAAGQIDVGDIEIDKLADADAGGVEELQHGLIPVALEIGTLGLLQQQLDLFAGEDLRQLFLRLLHMDIEGGVLVLPPAGDGEVIEALEARQTPGDGGGGLALVVEHRHIGGDSAAVHLHQGKFALLEIGGKLVQIPHIGGHRVAGGVLGFHQEILVLFHNLSHSRILT